MNDVTAYQRPKDLPAALATLSSAPFRIAGGCTDLFPATERKVLPGPILDITAVPELRGISRDAEGLRIGATTRWSDILRADLPAACRGLQLAAREVGGVQIQNQGTIGGNLCNASPAADGVPALLVLDATVELQSVRGIRCLPLPEFLLGPRRTARTEDEILTAIMIPEASLTGIGDFRKLGARNSLVISIAMVAGRFELHDGRLEKAALAVGACGPVATRLPALEAQILGRAPEHAQLDAAAISEALSPIDDIRGSASYRQSVVPELISRMIADLQEVT